MKNVNSHERSFLFRSYSLSLDNDFPLNYFLRVSLRVVVVLFLCNFECTDQEVSLSLMAAEMT